MWLDDLQPCESWMGVWKYKFDCGDCKGIIEKYDCSLCGFKHDMSENELIDSKGNVHKIQPALCGSISYITYTYIN